MISYNHKKSKVLFMGLDNAGKTTLMHLLKKERLVQHAPTQFPTSEELRVAGFFFQAFDLGGHKIARRSWSSYFTKVDGVVYLVDCSDRDRLKESKIVLDDISTNLSLSN